jgi:Fe-S oxidoreductase
MRLCVSCKGCRRECPTGVDMARLKIEVTARRVRERGLTLAERAVAFLPRYAPWLSRVAGLANFGGRLPGVSRLAARLLGFSPERSLPQWRKRFGGEGTSFGPADGHEVVLFADTFNRHFDPQILEAAVDVLAAAGCRVHLPRPAAGSRALCCGRTLLSAGLVDEARAEAERVIEALAPYVERGVAVVGLEPSCLLTLRDEFLVLVPGEATRKLAEQAMLFEEFLEAKLKSGALSLPLDGLPGGEIYLHGHCHQKAFAAVRPVEALLGRIPGMTVRLIESSCCGMAGAFGYAAETFDVSMRMAELSLLPAVRSAPDDALIVADGTSCRHQIKDGAARHALHAAVVLQRALRPDASASRARAPRG